MEASDADSNSDRKTEHEDKSESRSEIPEDESNDSNFVTPGEACANKKNDTIQIIQDETSNNSQSSLQQQGDKQQNFKEREEKLRQRMENKSKQAEIKTAKPILSTEQLTVNQKLQPKDVAIQEDNKDGTTDTLEQHKKDAENRMSPELKEKVPRLERMIKELQEKVQELEKEKEKVISLEDRLQNVTQELTEKEKEKVDLRKQVLELEQVNKELEIKLNDIKKENKKVELSESRRDMSDLKFHFTSEHPNEPAKPTGDHTSEDLNFFKHECKQLTEKYSQILEENKKLRCDVSKEKSWCNRLLDEKKINLKRLSALEQEVSALQMEVVTNAVSFHIYIPFFCCNQFNITSF